MLLSTRVYLLHFFLIITFYPVTTFYFLKPILTVRKIVITLFFWVFISTFLLISDLFNIVMVLGFYCIFRRYKRDYLILKIILIVTILCNIAYYLSESLLKISLYNLDFLEEKIMVMFAVLINILVLIILVWLIKKTYVVDMFQNKNNKLSALLTVYLYTVIRITIFISSYMGILHSTVIIINGLLIVQAVFTVIIFLITSHNQQKKYDFKLLKKQFDTLKDYTAELEYSQKVNAKFKHDYKNLLLSLKGSAESDNSSELINTISDLEQYSDNYFRKIEFDFRQCQNIKNDYLKSLVISKLSKAKQKEIDCHLECPMVIDKMPINQFDCVRMFGIVLDNAIEAAIETTYPRIDIMLYQDDNQLEFWVRNNYIANTLELKALRQANVSTKAGHSGLGLANIEEISQKHPNILKTFSKKKDIFSANIKILFN